MQEHVSPHRVDDEFANLVFAYGDRIAQNHPLEYSSEGDVGRYLQEKYKLPYNPDTTIRGVGETSLSVLMVRADGMVRQNAPHVPIGDDKKDIN